ncbi:hypothetical protein ACSVDE_17240 [Pseudalkalibacillus sp. Hm43]|uniref:hypothetical protein n=1 Tax=Pseudalkalibacillus sp. Hm43 TaxID=3450742 RepID=UPI003F43080C
MKYPLMDPPFKVIPFKEMTKQEAQRHFDWYVGNIQERMDLLKDAYSLTNSNNKDILDYSPQSLIPLWEWYLSQIEPNQKTSEELEREMEKVPEWLKNDVKENIYKPTTGTLILAMDISIYFSEVFTHNFNSIHWGFVSEPKSLAHVNSPVLLGFKAKKTLNARNLIYNMLLKAMKGNSDKASLYQLFDRWRAYV